MSTETTVLEFKNELPVMVPKYLKEIEGLKEKYGTLVLTDLNDKKQLASIAEGRKAFKQARVGVEKFMKGVRDGANLFSKSVIAKEKEIVALIEPEETRLQAEEDKYTAEQERIAEIKRKEEEQLFNDRVTILVGYDFKLTEIGYTLHGCKITLTEIRLMSKNDWETFITGDALKAFEKETAIKEAAEKLEQERIAEETRIREEEERLKREELLRLETQRQEQEAKEEELRKHMAEIEKKERAIKEREEKLRAEEKERQRKIDEQRANEEAENRKVVEEERRKKELEEAQKLAAERERQRIAKEAEEKEAKRIADEKKVAEKAARQPDKVKLLAYLNTIPVNVPIQLKSAPAKHIHEAIDSLLNMQIDSWKKEIENL